MFEEKLCLIKSVTRKMYFIIQIIFKSYFSYLKFEPNIQFTLEV